MDRTQAHIRPYRPADIDALYQIFLLPAVDPARHAIYACNLRGLVQITPPRRCWR